MSTNFLLDDIQGESDSAKMARIQRLTRWIWISFACMALFTATPSLIMYYYSPAQVNDVSPVDAHFLVFTLFGIGAFSLILWIIFLVQRTQALKK